MQWLSKYLLYFFISVTVYPKRGIAANEENFLTRKSNAVDKHLFEPGFDLTEDEMKKFKIWPNGLISYFIDDLSFDIILRSRLRSLLDFFNSMTGLVFSEIPGPPIDERERWVFFINRRGRLNCEDYTTNNFTNTGLQRVVLGYDCLDSKGLAATVLALAGVPPQHNAPNRDKYIDVIMDNIIPEKRESFKALNDNEWIFHDVPYDFLSAGHYGSHKYTTNGSATIIPKNQYDANFAIGDGNGLSDKDVLKIKMLYNYISLNRRKSKASACSKIFKLGKKKFDVKPKDPNIMEPRKKPSQYLGDTIEGTKQVHHENDTLTNNDKPIDEKIVSLKKNSLGAKINKRDKLDVLKDFDSEEMRRNGDKRELDNRNSFQTTFTTNVLRKEYHRN